MVRTNLALIAVALSLAAQTVYIHDSSSSSGAASNTIPWGQAAGYTSLHVYTAAQLQAAGVCGGAVLTDFAIAPSSAGTGLYNAPTAQMLIGHLSISPPVSGAWATHLIAPTVVHALTAGPYTFPYTLNTWTSLPGFNAAAFVWDGVTDIGVQYTSSSGTTGMFNAWRTPTNLRHGVNVFNATTQAATTNGLFAMKARLTFTGGAPLYQTNSPNSVANINGAVGYGCSKALTKVCAGNLVSINSSTATAGAPFDIAFNFAATSPLGGMGFMTSGGQIVNLDLTGGLSFINGGAGPFLVPHPGAFTIPFGMPPGLLASLQQLVVDPTIIDTVRLSQACQLQEQLLPFPIAGPVGDDVALSVTLPCGTQAFYGTSYTNFHVITNGNVQLGTAAASTAFSPTVAAAATGNGRIGHWADYNTAFGGSISITSPAPNQVSVDFNAIGYHTQTGTASTFGVLLDGATGAISITGINTIGAQLATGTENAFLGITRGAGATDPGAALFSPASTGVTVNSLQMLYNFGLAGTLAPGISTITFIPNGVGNYDWLSF
jgi:hypothetical protein